MNDTMSAYDHFHVEQVGDVTLVRLDSRRCNEYLLIGELCSELLALLSERNPTKLLVSCTGVQLLSSESIKALIRARQELRQHNGDLKLCNLRPEVLAVFNVLKLCDRVFEIYEDEADALQAFD